MACQWYLEHKSEHRNTSVSQDKQQYDLYFPPSQRTDTRNDPRFKFTTGLLKQVQLDTKNVIIVTPKKRLANLKYKQELMKLDNYMEV